jgi:cyclic nucleotide-binding protein
MPGRWRILAAVGGGDWQSKLIGIAQLAGAVVALLALLAMVTRHPLLLLGFTFVQGLAVVALVLFVVVALWAQRTMVLETFEPGEAVFEEGDSGRHVYVMKSGTVEVLRRRADGTSDLIRRLGTGDHFGEMALLREAPRNATVRAVTAVEVFRMSPNSFVALYTNLPGFREHFSKTMESRLRELEGGPSRG